jgi:hypothetical protein
MSEKETNPMNILYIILSIGMGIFSIYAINTKFTYLGLGFISKSLLFILTTTLGYIGSLVGDFLRKIAMPDAIFTRGGFSGMLKAKLFWFIGPQLIGIFVGGILAMYAIIKIAS